MADEGVFAAAKSIRPYLEQLLVLDAAAMDEQLARLLNDSQRDEESATRLRALLEARPETRMFLDAVLDDAPDFQPPGRQPNTLRGEAYSPLPGDQTPPQASRYRCPVGDDYNWWSPGVGTPIPVCPTHHVMLVADSLRS